MTYQKSLNGEAHLRQAHQNKHIAVVKTGPVGPGVGAVSGIEAPFLGRVADGPRTLKDWVSANLRLPPKHACEIVQR
jgi:hypothetical protein